LLSRPVETEVMQENSRYFPAQAQFRQGHRITPMRRLFF
jgi:hypothetical protein